ncbi:MULTISPECIES: tetratricopeptide repeat protein [Bacillus]|uniref:GTP-binding protein n=2 Tax=Bacillus thuringiensis TaxID=1428 RepID=A0A9X7D4Q5_BACTU|nr:MULTISPECIES: tetratricopeptide repeat family protein [Bacillus]AHA69734.1 Tetratricopeptide repeat family protein [Bacillus thuringiensis YBT-1518]ANC06014.1 GTP-binding protein [Bacillus cereus]ANC11841.1 GTP-binding protein [Bacillus cereus]EKS8370708.1 GTP-binding protein [Bacillus cereus]MBG9485066.1 GTP-binding protein [Bacillus thuringiensis]
MTIENQFIQKVYYKTFLTEETSTPASEVLGEAYINESKNEFSNISNIRFAQGEFYYQNKDFEAAIFKWEKVNNTLALWATKNIADAYFELGFLPKAEEIYQSIQTEDTTLTMEVSLQLLSLYIEQDRLGLAFKTISEAVAFQPDYPNITAIARSFYEKQEDWNNAIELAVQEGIRTQSLHWFDTLINYINKGFTKNIKPEYFYESLKALYAVDQAQFKELVIALWNSYQHESLYLPWIQSINHLFLHIETDNNDDWNEISTRYQETYFALITGNHFMHELNGLVPNLLTNWFSLTKAKDSLVVSAAVLAWNEVSPTTLESLLVKSAGSLLSNTSAEADVNMETVSHLFETIAVWAEKNDVDLSHQFTLLVHELCDLNVTPLLIAGTSDHDKTSFVNSILGENILTETLTTPILFKDASQTEITEFTELDIRNISNLDEFHQITATSAQSELEKKCIEIKLPSRFLRKNKFTFLITPSIQGQLDKNNAYFEYLQAADSLVYVLNSSSPLHSEEIDTLIYLREQVPNLQIHFVLHTNNTTTNEKLISKLKVHFPDAQFFPYSPSQESSQQLGDVTESILSNLAKRDIEKERIEKLIWFTQKTIAYLINERVELENTLVKSVRWNKHISVKLTGFINNLTALEKDKIRSITESYLLTKEEITRDIHSQIPELLQSCSDLVQEDSDFKLVHEELNAAMNERVQKHVQQVLLPKFTGSIQEWIETAHNEFIQAQAYLDEMSETFNKLYKEERMKLPCDFKLLDDWNRDVVRMTNRITVTNINILLRFTPTQFFLKSAGKLFGNMQKNQSMLANKYKQYIETEDYTEIAHTISKQFFLQFEVFEGALERDIMMFFKDPLSILKQNVDAAQLEIKEDEQTLATLRSNPETYHDPLALFKLQLLQHKFVLSTTKKHEDIFVSNESPTV